jgi:hypothetical protein
MPPSPTNVRRLFRFRLRTLLLLPLLFAVGWWWVNWPERTARRFVELLAAGNIEAAKEMSDILDDGVWQLAEIEGVEFNRSITEANSWRDYVALRRAFAVELKIGAGAGVLDGFAAQRNRVSRMVAGGRIVRVQYRLSYADTDSIKKVLAAVIVTKTGSRFFALPQVRTVVVDAPPQTQALIEALLRILDVRPQSRDPHSSSTIRQPVYRLAERRERIVRPTP